MLYVLYRPPNEAKREAFIIEGTGELIHEKLLKIGPRAIYRMKGVPDSLYSSDYPTPESKRMYLAKFKTLRDAKACLCLVNDYCGLDYEIRHWDNGALGDVVTE